MRYTKEVLAPIVKRNISVARVCRELGINLSGGSNSHISRMIDKFEIDRSHFKGQRSNFGENHKGGFRKKQYEEILVLRDPKKHRLPGRVLRRALLESGRPKQCGYCGLFEWRGKPILLVPDHSNGKFWDNRKENLVLSCPNCHSQTETFAGRNNRIQCPIGGTADAHGLDPCSFGSGSSNLSSGTKV